MELPIIREDELLEFLKISKAALYRLRIKKGLPYVSLTRKDRVYPAEQFMEWIKQNCKNDITLEDESN